MDLPRTAKGRVVTDSTATGVEDRPSNEAIEKVSKGPEVDLIVEQCVRGQSRGPKQFSPIACPLRRPANQRELGAFA